MALGERGELPRLLQHRRRGLRVLVGRVGRHLVPGEQAGVEHGHRDHADAAPLALGEQLPRGRLLQQRVPAREHDQVDQSRADRAGEHVGVLGADADGAHEPLLPHPGEGGQPLGEGLLRRPLLGIVGEEDVHAVHPEALEGLRMGAADAGLGEVPLPHVVVRDREGVRHVVPGARPGTQQTSDLRREQILLPRVLVQERAEATLGGADAVVRGGVEVTDPALPRGGDGACGLLVGGGPVEVPELRGAEAQRRQGERGALGRGGRRLGGARGLGGAHARPSPGASAGRDQTGRIPSSSPP